jgi:hypothetical protein
LLIYEDNQASVLPLYCISFFSCKHVEQIENSSPVLWRMR